MNGLKGPASAVFLRLCLLPVGTAFQEQVKAVVAPDVAVPQFQATPAHDTLTLTAVSKVRTNPLIAVQATNVLPRACHEWREPTWLRMTMMILRMLKTTPGCALILDYPTTLVCGFSPCDVPELALRHACPLGAEC